MRGDVGGFVRGAELGFSGGVEAFGDCEERDVVSVVLDCDSDRNGLLFSDLETPRT